MLFPSTLVVATNLSALDELISSLGHQSIKNDPDILLLEDYSIETVRSISNFLSLAPYNHDNKIVIIPQAEKLGIESQNCLLKSLEEPGEGNYFLLLTNRPNSLLSTIISRCHLIKNKPEEAANDFSILKKSTNISNSLSIVDSLGITKESIIPFLEKQLSLYHDELTKNPTPETSKFITKLIKSLNMSKANLDPKTVLDYLLLS